MPERGFVSLAAGLSFGAAAIHFAVIREHFGEDPLIGLAFVGLAWFQLAWGVVHLSSPSRRSALLAIAVNLVAVGIWLVSRTVGLPIGPDGGHVEPVGTLDVLATAFELVLVGLLFRSWSALGPAPIDRSRSQPPTTFVATLVVAVITATAMASTGGETHDHGTANSTAGPGSSFAVPSTGQRSADPGGSPGTPAPPGASIPALSPIPGVSIGTPAGTISFGARLGLGGEIEAPTATFRLGSEAVWVADLKDVPPGVPVRFLIFETLPNGRLFEHWSQDVVVADPAGRRIVGMADLSEYAHGGAGSYLLRYVAGDQVLAEGPFTLVP